MSDVPRQSQRRPRSPAPEQLVVDVTTATVPVKVVAWVLWEDGVEEQISAHAIAWTKRAVRIRWGAPPHVLEAWVWAGAVEHA